MLPISSSSPVFIHYKVWDNITYLFPNVSGEAADVWEWISNSNPHITGHVITHPHGDLSSPMLVKGAPGFSVLNVLVLEPKYARKFRSRPWLIMHCFLTSPYHQPSWYRLYSLNTFLFSPRRAFQLYYPNFEEIQLWYFFLSLDEFCT